jgi:(p)ppGpp synthase/HD superfamily hydrolase
MLLLEFGETDPALIMAAMGHDTLEDVELSQKYYPKLLGRVAGTRGEEVVHLIECVTNPTKTGDEKRDSALKAGHYELIGDNTKASKIKIADRCYNLRTLEVHQKDATDITEKDIQTADKQLEETENFILPLAEKI